MSKNKGAFFFSFLTGEKKVNPELKCPSINQLKRGETKKNNNTLI